MNTTTKAELAEVSSNEIATLPPAARAAVVLKSEQTRKDLATLVANSAGILTVLNADAREQAHRVGMTLKNARVTIEKTGKAAREDATAFSKAVIQEEKALIALIEPEEERVLSLRDKWDEKIEAEKAAKIAAERARVEAIQAMIQKIRNEPVGLAGKTAGEIAAWLTTENPDRDFDFMEFSDAAADAIAESLIAIRGMLTKAQASEAAALAAEEARKAEAARIEAERAELAKLRAEQAERERLAKIETDRIAGEQAKEAKRLADLAAAQESEAARVRAEDDARAAAAAEQQRQLAAQQAELEARQAAFAREQAEAAEREANRVRLQALADQHLADNRLPLPESVTVRDALIDDGIDDLDPTDDEITAMGAECGLTPGEWVIRLSKYIAAREMAA
jgi:hypothetical protein